MGADLILSSWKTFLRHFPETFWPGRAPKAVGPEFSGPEPGPATAQPGPCMVMGNALPTGSALPPPVPRRCSAARVR